MDITVKEIKALEQSAIVKYRFYNLSLDAIGTLMKKSCLLYATEVREIYNAEIEKTKSLNLLRTLKYRIPKKHHVSLETCSKKKVIMNRVKTSRVDVLLIVDNVNRSKDISFKKIFNHPDYYSVDFVLDNYVLKVRDEYKVVTKKWIQMINTLNRLSDEISNSLKMLLHTYGQFIVDSNIQSHSPRQVHNITKKDFRSSIEQIYAELFMLHKEHVDCMYTYLNGLRKQYFLQSKLKVSEQGYKQRDRKKADVKFKPNAIFNPVSLKCKIGNKYSKAIPNGEIFLTNITIELYIYTQMKATLSKSVKPIMHDDGTKKFVLEMIMQNRIQKVPQYLTPLIECLLHKLEQVLDQKKQLFNEIHSLCALINLIDRNDNFISLTKTS